MPFKHLLGGGGDRQWFQSLLSQHNRLYKINSFIKKQK